MRNSPIFPHHSKDLSEEESRDPMLIHGAVGCVSCDEHSFLSVYKDEEYRFVDKVSVSSAAGLVPGCEEGHGCQGDDSRVLSQVWREPIPVL